MDLHYAKAYMRERLEDADIRRLVAEGRRVEFDESRPSPWRNGLASLLQTVRPVRIRDVKSQSLEPACCPT